MAMIQYAVKGVGIENETMQITSDLSVEPGSCVLYWLRFHAMRDDGSYLLLHFHVNVNEDNTGEYSSVQ